MKNSTGKWNGFSYYFECKFPNVNFIYLTKVTRKHSKETQRAHLFWQD